jgi:hypothetical protein
VPFADVTVTPEMLRKAMTTVAQKGGEYLLHLLQGAAGGVVGGLTAAILFIYVFISLLTNKVAVQRLIRQLNPLGEEVTDLYLAKMGAMVGGTVKGQFIIAVCQGVAGAISIYVGGFHDGFFIFAVVLSALSVIPLGSGIITIPFGVGMMLFGNVFGGLFVVLFHIIVVTNIDNVLRPILVPREARLDSAHAAVGVRRNRDVRCFRHRHRPGADDRDRDDHQRLPRRVQGRTAGTAGGRRHRTVQEKEERAATLDAQGQEVRTGGARTRCRGAQKGLGL